MPSSFYLPATSPMSHSGMIRNVMIDNMTKRYPKTREGQDRGTMRTAHCSSEVTNNENQGQNYGNIATRSAFMDSYMEGQ
mmetsp:Transcript_37132/g.56988  ORF Transcript_37132/g.56988 Transcript_37132/m.56988 type:complete len:80 (+) Transcript_37132:3906-4145(+)